MAKRSSESRRREKVRYGVVGLGYIAQKAVLPAFAHAAENSELVALISDSRDKLEQLGDAYGVEGRYRYDELERCIDEQQLDAVYIALPNSMHKEFVMRSFECAAHVLCEKPLALSATDCREMGRAARANKVYLMTAYRLHFDQANMESVRIIREGKIGAPKIFSSVFSFQVADQNYRLSAYMGGGSLLDIGIYQINAARYLFQDEPVSVQAQITYREDSRFSEVEGSCSALLRFPGERMAQLTCSFAAGDCSYFEMIGSEGRLRLEHAYEYSEGSQLFLQVGKRTTMRAFKQHDQFAAELLYFSRCIMQGEMPEPSAEEAEADLRIIEAIRESARAGNEIVLRGMPQRQARPDEDQIITRPALEDDPRLVDVSPAHMQ